ncbi:MAG TPA: universal stress protein [Anaerolineae bacterium]|nr:universal stress protein [Anaerolineae bacterium]
MYRRILVPLDGSSLAEQALPHAAAQAQRFEAEVVLLKVLEPLPQASFSSPVVVRKAEELSAQLAREYLDRVAARLQEQGLGTQVSTVEGKPYVEIIQYAEQHAIDMMVMSTRGHSGWSRWLLGSVADRVVRGATVPVLLVRCQEACDE